MRLFLPNVASGSIVESVFLLAFSFVTREFTMSVIAKLNLLSRLSIHPSRTLINAQCIAPFSTIPSKGSSQAIGKKRFRLSVEKDINKLMNHCCGTNYHKEGEDVKLKDDSEYPDWLWEMPLEPPRLHEYDPATKEYWEKAEIVGRQRENKLEGITNVSYPLN